MIVSLAQVESKRGDITANIEKHVNFILEAVKRNSDFILFPELSITGYEPSLAAELATTEHDQRFNVFQELSDSHDITIGIGVPINSGKGVQIGLVFFKPHLPRHLYCKNHLHEDETPFFIEGESAPVLKIGEYGVGLAICYELSLEDHWERVFQKHVDFCVINAAKTKSGMLTSIEVLSERANRCNTPILITNAVGQSEGFVSSGQSTAIGSTGQLISKLEGTQGLMTLIFENGNVRVL